jgi:serpin B
VDGHTSGGLTIGIFNNTPEIAKVANAFNTFAVDLYKVLALGDENIFLSPFGVAIALAALFIGARGPTAEEIKNALHVDSSAGEAIPYDFASLLAKVHESPADHSEEINIANAIWTQQGLPVEPLYREWIQELFGGAIFEADLRHMDETRLQVDAWISEQTRGRITLALPPSFFLPTPGPLAFLLLNVVYFRREWHHIFDKMQTKNGSFFLLNGREISLPFMHLAASVNFAKSGDVQYIELLYRGETTAMGILLPTKRNGLLLLEEDLTIGSLYQLINSCKSTHVVISLPRFTIDTTFDLLPAIKQLGIINATDEENADFSGISYVKTYLSGAFHRTRVEVDEKGTVALAVSAMSSGMRDLQLPYNFVADHPFLFIIRHVKTGQILFLGRWTGIASE